MRPLGDFERAVLLVLIRLGEDAYGVIIRNELQNRLEREVALGAVYTTLDRLQEKGFVTSWLGAPTPARGGRSKRFYRIEAEGYAALESARQRAAAVWALDPSAGRL